MLWLSFTLAAIVASFTAMSYAELAAIYPEAGAEYIYAKNAFGWDKVAWIFGFIAIIIGFSTASAVALGFARYLSYFIPMNQIILAIGLLVLMTAINFWGIKNLRRERKRFRDFFKNDYGLDDLDIYILHKEASQFDKDFDVYLDVLKEKIGAYPELINKGAALSTQYIGQTPLDLAIEATLDNAVSKMLNKEMVTSNPQDLLLRSISSGLNFENIKLIADSGMDMNHQDEEGLTALGMALLFGSEPRVVKLLLDRGASTKIKVNVPSPLLVTATPFTDVESAVETDNVSPSESVSLAKTLAVVRMVFTVVSSTSSTAMHVSAGLSFGEFDAIGKDTILVIASTIAPMKVLSAKPTLRLLSSSNTRGANGNKPICNSCNGNYRRHDQTLRMLPFRESHQTTRQQLNKTLQLALDEAGFMIEEGEELMEKARSIKSPDEILAMKCAVHACEKAVEEMHEITKPGLSENEIWAHLHAGNIKRGGEWIETRLLTSGPRTNPWFQECGPRVLQNNEILSFDTDLVGNYGFCADISRSWWIGDHKPPQKMVDAYRHAFDHINENMQILKPGLSFKDMTHQGHHLDDKFQKLKYGCKYHGIGLSASIRMAANELKFTEDNATVILISDGKETCNADPCGTAAELEKLGVNFTAHVIGFGVDKSTTKQLQCIADNTGGKYFGANNAKQLNDAFKKVVEQPKKLTLRAIDEETGANFKGKVEWTITNQETNEVINLPTNYGQKTLPIITEKTKEAFENALKKGDWDC
ncbi:Dimethlysulfonioproprionate lyase DddP [Nymphon striatum]|nr:Dimethlysulfonioproprionate lyase DddP [Nymphon striatum]